MGGSSFGFCAGYQATNALAQQQLLNGLIIKERRALDESGRPVYNLSASESAPRGVQSQVPADALGQAASVINNNKTVAHYIRALDDRRGGEFIGVHSKFHCGTTLSLRLGKATARLYLSCCCSRNDS